MATRIARRDTLKLIAGASAAGIIGAPTILRAAESFPTHPITLVNPNPPVGYNDNLCRVAVGPMTKRFGQPVTVLNIPGASEMLGHVQYLTQPDDGYYLMCSSCSFIPMNILLQGAKFNVTDFQMINLSGRDHTMVATGLNNDKLRKIEDVVAALKKDPSSLSVGAVKTSPDNINMVLFMNSIGVDVSKMRIVTFESGGTVRTAVLGGVVDIGFAGQEAWESIADQITPLLLFDNQRGKVFANAPTSKEAALGKPFDPVAGALRGFAVQATMKAKHPEIFTKVVGVMEGVYKDPKVIDALTAQSLTPTWYGPENSQEVYLKTCEQMKQYVGMLKSGKG